MKGMNVWVADRNLFVVLLLFVHLQLLEKLHDAVVLHESKSR